MCHRLIFLVFSGAIRISFALQTSESHDAFDKLFAKNEEELQCKSDMTSLLKDIRGL